MLGFTLIPDKNTSTVDNTAGTVTTTNQTTGASERIGYGLIGQVRITNHFYVDVNRVVPAHRISIDQHGDDHDNHGLERHNDVHHRHHHNS